MISAAENESASLHVCRAHTTVFAVTIQAQNTYTRSFTGYLYYRIAGRFSRGRERGIYMKKPKLDKDRVIPLLETKYINVTDLQYEGLHHYYNVSRRPSGAIAALKTDDEFRTMLPDAVTCIVIVRVPSADQGREAKLLLTKEFRYPVGQFLLSPPAGLMDPSDRSEPVPQIATARREIKEETGLALKDTDRIFVVNPLSFSSPGMTDEGNALVCAVAEIEDESVFNSDGEESTELIGDYKLFGRADALRILKQGQDDEGIFYSVYTWIALMYFVSGLWEEEL